MNKDNMRDELYKILARAIFGDDQEIIKHLENYKTVKSEIEQDDCLVEELKEAGLNEKQITVAKDIMMPFTSAMTSFVSELPPISQITKFKKEEIELLGEENLPLVIYAALMKGIEYSSDLILDRCGMSVEDRTNAFLDKSRKEVEDYAEKMGIDPNRIIPVGLRTAKDPQTNELISVDIYNISTGKEIHWNDLHEKVREAMVEQLKSDGDDKVLEILEKKFGKLTEEDKLNKEDFKTRTRKINLDDGTIGEVPIEEENHPEASLDEFFDFFSDVLKGIGGVK